MRDPFFKQMPLFFNVSFQQLMKDKHPTAWIEFETGSISEAELFRKFFSDGREFDGEALRQTMVSLMDKCHGNLSFMVNNYFLSKSVRYFLLQRRWTHTASLRVSKTSWHA